jgi:NAD-dependent deacetylase sirtuin 2
MFTIFCDRVTKKCPRLLINRDKAGQRDRLMTLLRIGSGMDFDSENNFRDVAWLGDCDEGCQMLADKLGWGVSCQVVLSWCVTYSFNTCIL